MSNGAERERQVTEGDDGPTCHLEMLPTEILLMILSHVPDLASLGNLVRASPTLSRVFNGRASEIAEDVLSSGHTCRQIRAVICLAAQIRSRTLPMTSMKQFKKQAIKEAMRWESRLRLADEGLAPDSLPGDTEPAVVRSILATARRLAWLSHDCFHFYLAQLSSVGPDRLVNAEQYVAISDGDPWEDHEVTFLSPWEYKPRGRRDEDGDTSPPTWIEEQRVNRAFWRVQLFHDLKMAAGKRLLDWPEDDRAVLRGMEPERFYDKMMHLDRTDWSSFSHKDPERQEILSVLDYVREVHGKPWPVETPAAFGMWRHYQVRGQQDHRELIDPSPAVVSDLLYYKGPIWHEYSRSKFVKLDDFRRFGFAFWSAERLSSHGFHRAQVSDLKFKPAPGTNESGLGSGGKNEPQKNKAY